MLAPSAYLASPAATLPLQNAILAASLPLQLHTALESGDSSVVTRWTVDQEIVGSNPVHGRNLISVVRSLSGFTQPIP